MYIHTHIVRLLQGWLLRKGSQVAPALVAANPGRSRADPPPRRAPGRATPRAKAAQHVVLLKMIGGGVDSMSALPLKDFVGIIMVVFFWSWHMRTL